MAIDFPASPTNGQVFTSGGTTYVFNGTGWTIKGGTTLDWVLRAGDTMTGPLVLPADPAAALQASTKQYVDAVRSYVDTQNTAQNATLDTAMKAYAAPLDALAYNGMQVNGGMDVSQEWGTSGVTNAGYVVDAWAFGSSGVSVNCILYTNLITSGFPTNCSVIAAPLAAKPSLAASDYIQLRQGIEGYRMARLRWGISSPQPITLCFWSGHNRTGVYSGSIKNYANTRCYVFTYTQNVTDAIEYKTITIPGCPDGVWEYGNNLGMYVGFTFAAGSTHQTASTGVWLTSSFIASTAQVNSITTTNDKCRIMGVCIVPGIYAPTAAQSPLIMRPFDQELLLCKRYYFKPIYAANQMLTVLQAYSANTGNGPFIQFPVEMRAAPTLGSSAGANFTLQAPTGGGGTLASQTMTLTPTYAAFGAATSTTSQFTPGHAVTVYANTAGAYFSFDARL